MSQVFILIKPNFGIQFFEIFQTTLVGATSRTKVVMLNKVSDFVVETFLCGFI